MEIGAGNYAGSLVQNDVSKFHDSAKDHFEVFKRTLAEGGVKFEKFKDNKAQILTLYGKDGKAKCHVYFQGSKSWWGFSFNSVQNIIEKKDGLPVYLVCYADTEERHFFSIKLFSIYDRIKDKATNTGNTRRWMFNEINSSKTLYNNYDKDLKDYYKCITGNEEMINEIKKYIS